MCIRPVCAPINHILYKAQETVVCAASKIVSLFCRVISAFVNFIASVKNKILAIPGAYVAKYVLPAMKRCSKEYTKAFRDLFEKQALDDAAIVKFQTQSGLTLDGIRLCKDDKIVPSEQRWIVYFLPNAACWEDMADAGTLAEIYDSGANVLCYNYRGVSHSTGSATSEFDLRDDAQEIVQSLLDKGIKPEHLALHGFSLGGAVATLTACDFHDKGISLALCNERSLSSLQAVIAQIKHGTILGLAAAIFRWRLNTASRLDSLPERLFAMSHPKDMVIETPASFVEALQAHPKANQAHIKVMDDIGGNAHCRNWDKEEREAYYAWIREALAIST